MNEIHFSTCVGAYISCWTKKIKNKKHRALLTTCERTIAPGGCVLVFYTHHRPHLAHRDMEFFKIAGEMRWECEKVFTERFPVRVLVVVRGGGGGSAIFTQQSFSS